MRIENIDSKSILEYYGVKNLSQDDNELKFSCPFPEHVHGDRNPSSGINTKTNAYNCFSCHRKGTIVNFVAEMEGISEAVAIRFIREDFYKHGDYESGSVLDGLKHKFEKPVIMQGSSKGIPDAALSSFRVDWQGVTDAMEKGEAPKSLSYIIEAKGFSVETLHKFDIGFDMNSNRITIPWRDRDGTIVGIKGRATQKDQIPKYKSIGDKPDQPPYYGFFTTKINNYVFGIDSVESDHIIICEGEFDAISLRQKGFLGSVALGTSSIRNDQAREIRKVAKDVTILMDNDSAGQKAVDSINDLLNGFITARIGICPVGKDPAEMNKKEIEHALLNAESSVQKMLQTI